jgi:hypothetical protein
MQDNLRAAPARRPQRRNDRREQLPTWKNTSPRENQPVDRRDLDRSLERMETVLGR